MTNKKFQTGFKWWPAGLTVIIVLLLAITGVRVFYSLDSETPEASQERSSPQVELLQIKEFDTTRSLEVAGEIEARDQARISGEVAGMIRELRVTVGETVRAGQVLATLETASASVQLEQAQAALLAEKAKLAEMQAGERAERLAIQKEEVKRAEKELQEAHRQAESNIKTAREELFNNDLQAYVDDPRAHLRQYEDIDPPRISGVYQGREEGTYKLSLYRSNTQSGYSFKFQGPTEEGVASVNTRLPQPLGQSGLYIQFPPDFDQNSHLNWTIPIPNDRSAGYVSARRAYEKAVDDKEPMIEQARDNLKRQQEQLNLLRSGTREEQIAGQKAGVARAEANVKAAEVQLDKSFIRAPFNGKVGSTQVEPGENISPGQTLISLINDELLFLKIFNGPEQAKKIKVGNKALVEGRYSGVVDSKAPGINPETGQVEFRILISEPSELIVGEYVQARILTDKEESRLQIPLSAVRSTTTGAEVMVVKDGRAEPITVETGAIEGGQIEIISGLTKDRSIIKNLRQISAGQSVEVN